MAHPYFHSISSAKKFGGRHEDYIELHTAMDYTKSFNPDCRHRLFTHNAWGIWLMQRIWGQTLTRKSDGRAIPIRPLLEQHIEEDFGFIPTLERCFRGVETTETTVFSAFEQAQYNVDLWGGQPEEYIALHNFLDWPFDYLPDNRALRLLHNTWGVLLCEQVFGLEFNGIETRFLAETHIMREIGELPTLEAMLTGIKLEKKWMCKGARPLSRELEEEHA